MLGATTLGVDTAEMAAAYRCDDVVAQEMWPPAPARGDLFMTRRRPVTPRRLGQATAAPR